MKRLILLFLLLPITLIAQGFGNSIAFLGASAIRPASGGGGGGGPPGVSLVVTNSGVAVTTYMTNNFTISASDANRLLIVSFGVGDDGFQIPYDLRLNGTTITNNLLWNTNAGAGNWVANYAYYAIAPPTGTNQVIWQASNPMQQLSMASIVFTNVAQTGTFGTAVGKGVSGSTPSITVSSAAGTALVYCSVTTDAQTTLAVNNGTLKWLVANLDGDTDHGGSILAGGASVTPSWTSGAANYAIGAVSINGAP